MNNLESLNTLARGAVNEQFNYEMTRVLKNILDPNTKPTGTRSVTLKVTFKPTEDRATVVLSIEAKSALAPAEPAKTTLLLDQAPGGGVIATEVGRRNEIPGQVNTDGEVFSPRRAGLTVVGE